MHTHRHPQTCTDVYLFHTHIISFSSNPHAWSKGTSVAVGWQSEVAFRILLALCWDWEGLAGPCVYKLHQPAECKTAHPHSQSNPAQGLPVPLYGVLERCTNASLMAQTWSRESREYNGRFSALNAGSDENLGFMTLWMRYSEYCGKSHQGWLNKHKRRIPKIVSRI